MDRLIAAVWPEAYRIAQSILFDSGLAEDAAQEACATIANSLPDLKHVDRFAAWSYRIIVNGALMTARRRPRTQALDALAERGAYADTSEALDIQSALATLPSVQRAAIVLHYYAGLNSAEIAAATGLVASTVRFHLMLARRGLRKVLTGTSFAAHSPEEVLPHVY
ncbi:MAG: sigma-70 family RNA polymerase sigma factor [Candidatus Eremiobacteraeota bacterium]|nr:sigma-70 family RNA polymerase sigma factor [Candidatus Eremiobacteraeota bacterium]